MEQSNGIINYLAKKETSSQFQGIVKKGNRQCESRTIVSEVLSFLSNPVLNFGVDQVILHLFMTHC